MKSVFVALGKIFATFFLGLFACFPEIALLLFGLAFVEDRLPQPVLGIAQWLFDDPLGIIIGSLVFIVIAVLAFGASFWLATEKIWRH